MFLILDDHQSGAVAKEKKSLVRGCPSGSARVRGCPRVLSYISAVVRALVSLVGIYIYIINIIILSCPRVGLPRHCRLSAGFRSFSVFSMFFVSMPQPFLCSLSACSRNYGCEFFHSCGTMSVSEGTQAETTLQYLCKFCGMLYPESAGRLHGKTFVCTPCGNHDRALRRNLGQQSELGTFSPEESKDFFRKCCKEGKKAPPQADVCLGPR